MVVDIVCLALAIVMFFIALCFLAESFLISIGEKKGPGPALAFIALALLSISLALLIGLTIYKNYVPQKDEYVLDSQLELVALQDNNGIHGDFFLGSGFIESELYYVFYYKYEDKEGAGFKTDRILAKNAIVYEQIRNDGLVKIYKFSRGGFLRKTVFERYEIFIPKGSILRQFQLDAK